MGKIKSSLLEARLTCLRTVETKRSAVGERTAGLWCHDRVRDCCMLVVALVHVYHH